MRAVPQGSDAARQALRRGWADHQAGRARWRDDWARLARECNPRQCLLTHPGEPVPLVLSADGARGYYLLGLAALDESELSEQALLDAVYFLSETTPGKKIDQDLVPGIHPQSEIPPGNLAWLRARGLWADGPCALPGDGPARGQEDRSVPPTPSRAAPSSDGALEPLAAYAGPDPDDVLPPLEVPPDVEPRPQGLVGPCSVCGRLPGAWHKCCPTPQCSTSADGAQDVERLFGLRTLRGRAVPQTWCRRCRSRQPTPPEQLALAMSFSPR